MIGPLVLDGAALTVDRLGAVALAGENVALDPAARGRVEEGRRLVEEAIREKRIVYGVDTGFGGLADVSIDAGELVALQLNLIRSHAAGTGPPLAEELVRAMMIAKANALLLGHGGVRWEIPEALCGFLNHGITPVIPSIGSLGASGDLAPLAHLSLALVGEGEVMMNGEKMSASRALGAAGLEPLRLEAKEGLGLINGTQGITAILAVALHHARRIAVHAAVAAGLSTEALRGTNAAWDERLYAARPHPGAIRVATLLRKMMRGSTILKSHADCGEVQDAYSIRCAPTVLGAVLDVIDSSVKTTERELNSATGNPLCFPEDGAILSGGNFHGEPVAFAADFLAIAFAEVGSIAERRIARLVDPKLSGLPPYLAARPGLESGYMIAQYTAAALVSENKVLAHPASVDSIPTSGNQEDHVSMGFHGAKKALQVVENVERAVAVELIVAACGIDRLAPLEPGDSLVAAHRAIRSAVEPLDADRSLTADIEKMIELMRRGDIIAAARIEVPG